MNEGVTAGAESGGDDFGGTLSRAIAARGVPLTDLAAAVTGAGVPVTAATLSYWASGRSLPRRRSSLDVVIQLERLLGLRAGELIAKAPVQTDTWRYRGSARQGLVPDTDELSRLREEWELPWDEGLRREFSSTAVNFDPEYGPQQIRHQMVFTAQRDGAHRFLSVIEPEEHLQGPVAELNMQRGAAIGRTRVLPSGRVAYEVIVHDRAREGQTSIVEYTVPLSRAALESESFANWTLRANDVFITQVRLPRHGGPTRFSRSVSAVDVRGVRVERRDPFRPITAPVVQAVLTQVTTAHVDIRWSR